MAQICSILLRGDSRPNHLLTMGLIRLRLLYASSSELIAGFDSVSRSSLTDQVPSLRLIPLPHGTANALFNALFPFPACPRSHPHLKSNKASPETVWSLQSVLAYLESRLNHSETSRLIPLALTRTELYASSGDGSEPIAAYTSHVVTSLALHSNILDVSESLREAHPTVERFKIAASTLLPLRFSGTLTLGTTSSTALATPTTTTLYNPRTETFQPIVNSADLTLQGPFSYLLSSTSVDRLEPSFIILPLLSSKSEESKRSTMDLIVLRPGRGKSVQADLDAGGNEDLWATKVKDILGGAYKGWSVCLSLSFSLSLFFCLSIAVMALAHLQR